jgi:hypothetical protein
VEIGHNCEIFTDTEGSVHQHGFVDVFNTLELANENDRRIITFLTFPMANSAIGASCEVDDKTTTCDDLNVWQAENCRD